MVIPDKIYNSSTSERYFSGRYYSVEYTRENFNPTKKLVIYTKNRPRVIEVTVNEKTETKYSKQIQVTTKNGKTMWVNKKELF